MKRKKFLLIVTLLLVICTTTVISPSARASMEAVYRAAGREEEYEAYIKRKAEERAKVIDEKWGEGAYGGTADLNQSREHATKMKEDPSYEEGYEKGKDIGHEYGFSIGRSEGYHSGYQDGYDTGYEDGYRDRVEEDTAERKKEFKLLMYIAIGIIIIVLFLKSRKENQQE